MPILLAGLSEGEHPFATVLGRSDSRVPSEIIFEAGFGDLLMIRNVAGNVISPEVIGSIKYAGAHLGTRLIMVLGHEGCGAVQAALAAKFQGAQERSRIEPLLQVILPGGWTRGTRSFQRRSSSPARSRLRARQEFITPHSPERLLQPPSAPSGAGPEGAG